MKFKDLKIGDHFYFAHDTSETECVKSSNDRYSYPGINQPGFYASSIYEEVYPKTGPSDSDCET